MPEIWIYAILICDIHTILSFFILNNDAWEGLNTGWIF